MKKRIILTCLLLNACAAVCITLLWADYPQDRFLESGPVKERVITDTVTGLVWTKNYAPDKTWRDALEYCETLNYAGHIDWRLPNKKELVSLVSYERYNPASDFPGMPPEYFWSSSSMARGTSRAWRVAFYYGDVGNCNKTTTCFVRCVRDGP